MPQLSVPKSLFRYQSGRVIALGRVMLVTCFLIALLLDRGDASQEARGTFGLLLGYEVLAIVIAAVTWRNWWLDARLAVATHALDMAVFTAIVFSANGTTSPFFLFFVLPLLSAAIRWSWRETALTATTLVVLAPHCRVPAGRDPGLRDRALRRPQRAPGDSFAAAHLVRGPPALHTIAFPIDQGESKEAEAQNPLVQALALARSATEAGGGALVIGPLGEEPSDGIAVVGGERRVLQRVPPAGPTSSTQSRPVARHSAQPRPDAGARRPFQVLERLTARIESDELRGLGFAQGLIVEVRTGTQQGWLALWDVPDLSTDFIDFGRELGRAVGGILDRYALLNAIESGAAARTRLSLARDVHDSVVQFLAGASFRVEAIKRSAKDNPRLGAELDELKRLLVEEQGEVRGFVLALRRGRELELAEAAAELRALAERLSQQWSVKCQVRPMRDGAQSPSGFSSICSNCCVRRWPTQFATAARTISSRARRRQGQLSLRSRTTARVSHGQRRERSNPGRSRNVSSAPTARSASVGARLDQISHISHRLGAAA